MCRETTTWNVTQATCAVLFDHMTDSASVLHNDDMKNENPNLYFYKRRQRKENQAFDLLSR